MLEPIVIDELHEPIPDTVRRFNAELDATSDPEECVVRDIPNGRIGLLRKLYGDEYG